MINHDPRKAIELLRNHLATHDVPISFFLGAGTSSSIKINNKALFPTINILTEGCKNAIDALGTEYAAAWIALVAECTDLLIPCNIESILSRIHTKIEALSGSDKSLGLEKDKFIQMEMTIRKTIATQVTPDESLIPASIPHDRFARWIKNITRRRAVEIFTTNYDILIERSLEHARMPVFDGFIGTHRPFFYPESVENDDLIPKEWVRLWKIHGSVNWHKNGKAKNIHRGPLSKDGLYILPSHLKYDESRKQPYQSFIFRLAKVLSHNDALMITCGYSFGDQHINEIIFNALDNNIKCHVIALLYNDIKEDDNIVKQSLHRENFIIMGKNAGVINCKWGEWLLTEPAGAYTHHFIDLLFDSDAEPDPDKKSLTGQMRVGDFDRLSISLSEIAGDRLSSEK